MLAFLALFLFCKSQAGRNLKLEVLELTASFQQYAVALNVCF